MVAVSKFHDIRIYRSLVITPNVTVHLNHRSKNEFWIEPIFFELGKTIAKMYQMIQEVYDNEYLSLSTIYEYTVVGKRKKLAKSRNSNFGGMC